MIVSQIITLAVVTLIGGFIFSRLGKKFFSISMWHYFIPYYNTVPLLKCAKMSPLFAIIFAIGGVLGMVINIKVAKYGSAVFQFFSLSVYAYYIFLLLTMLLLAIMSGKIAKRLGKSFWLNTIFSWTGIPILIFAFDKSIPIYDNSEEIV